MNEGSNVPESTGPAKEKSRTGAIVAWIAGAVLALCVCLPVVVIAVMRLLGPKIGNTFSTISSSLP
jgi:hypothetical protein